MTHSEMSRPNPFLLFSEGFRFFFLAAGLYAVFTGMIWILWLAAPLFGASFAPGALAEMPMLWHAHEMIFGYGTAALAGFFLTAVPNWTGGRAARREFIAAIALLWLGARVAVWMSGVLPALVVAVLDLAFLPVLVVNLLLQLLKKPKPQNLILLSVLAAIWAGNLLVHLDWLNLRPGAAETGFRVGVLALCGLIAVLGGRITPAFTRNAMKRAGAAEPTWPRNNGSGDKAVIVTALLLPWSALIFGSDARLPAVLAVLLALGQIVRMAGWRTFWSLRFPILAVLHLGLGGLALGMGLWGLSGFGVGSELAALHVLGIGSVGVMTMAVMSRAALGHTGRALIAPRPVALAYGLLVLAACLRWLGAYLSGGWSESFILGAGALWTLAFAIFATLFWPVLTGPRVDRA